MNSTATSGSRAGSGIVGPAAAGGRGGSHQLGGQGGRRQVNSPCSLDYARSAVNQLPAELPQLYC